MTAEEPAASPDAAASGAAENIRRTVAAFAGCGRAESCQTERDLHWREGVWIL